MSHGLSQLLVRPIPENRLHLDVYLDSIVFHGRFLFVELLHDAFQSGLLGTDGDSGLNLLEELGLEVARIVLLVWRGSLIGGRGAHLLDGRQRVLEFTEGQFQVCGRMGLYVRAKDLTHTFISEVCRPRLALMGVVADDAGQPLIGFEYISLPLFFCSVLLHLFLRLVSDLVLMLWGPVRTELE